MYDPITQMRLASRLDSYLSEYTNEQVGDNHLAKEQKWNVAWRVADVARVQHTLTPELVDDVRIALRTL